MSAARLFRVTAWLLVAAIVVLSLVKPSLRPVLLPHNLEHALVFAGAGFLAAFAYPARPARLMLILILFAAGIEIAQFFAPGRHPSRIDFAVDAVSACIGAALAVLLLRLRARP